MPSCTGPTDRAPQAASAQRRSQHTATHAYAVSSTALVRFERAQYVRGLRSHDSYRCSMLYDAKSSDLLSSGACLESSFVSRHRIVQAVFRKKCTCKMLPVRSPTKKKARTSTRSSGTESASEMEARCAEDRHKPVATTENGDPHHSPCESHQRSRRRDHGEAGKRSDENGSLVDKAETEEPETNASVCRSREMRESCAPSGGKIGHSQRRNKTRKRGLLEAEESG